MKKRNNNVTLDSYDVVSVSHDSALSNFWPRTAVLFKSSEAVLLFLELNIFGASKERLLGLRILSL